MVASKLFLKHILPLSACCFLSGTNALPLTQYDKQHYYLREFDAGLFSTSYANRLIKNICYREAVDDPEAVKDRIYIVYMDGVKSGNNKLLITGISIDFAQKKYSFYILDSLSPDDTGALVNANKFSEIQALELLNAIEGCRYKLRSEYKVRPMMIHGIPSYLAVLDSESMLNYKFVSAEPFGSEIRKQLSIFFMNLRRQPLKGQ